MNELADSNAAAETLSVVPRVYVPLLLVTVGVGLLVTAVAVRYRFRRSALCLALFAGVASGVTLAHALVLARATPAEMEWLTRVGLSLAALLPVAWLALVFRYTGMGRWAQFPRLGVVFIEPLVFIGSIWTLQDLLVLSGSEPVSFGAYSLLAVEFGLLYWAHQVVVALYFLIGGLLLGRLLVRRQASERRQATAILGAGAAVLVANTLFSFGLFPAGMDPTGVVGVLASVLLVMVLFADQLRSIAPAAREVGRETVLDDLDDAIIMLDEQGNLIDSNPAGEQLLGMSKLEYRGQPIESIRPEIDSALESDTERTEIVLDDGGTQRHYDLRATALSHKFNILSGTVISLRDITAQRQQRQRLDVLNRLLRHNIRNELNVVRGKIELAELETESTGAHEQLTEAKAAVDTIVDRANKVGRLSRMLDSEISDAIDIGQELQNYYDAGGFDHEGAEIHFDVPDSLPVSGGPPLVAAFEELVSNAIAHNDSPTATVTIRFDESRSDSEQAVIAVQDNGPGIDEQEWKTIIDGHETPLHHSSGVGLWLVNWIVMRAGGSIAFETEQNKTQCGTTVRISLPRSTGVCE